MEYSTFPSATNMDEEHVLTLCAINNRTEYLITRSSGFRFAGEIYHTEARLFEAIDACAKSMSRDDFIDAMSTTALQINLAYTAMKEHPRAFISRFYLKAEQVIPDFNPDANENWARLRKLREKDVRRSTARTITRNDKVEKVWGKDGVNLKRLLGASGVPLALPQRKSQHLGALTGLYPEWSQARAFIIQ